MSEPSVSKCFVLSNFCFVFSLLLVTGAMETGSIGKVHSNDGIIDVRCPAKLFGQGDDQDRIHGRRGASSRPGVIILSLISTLGPLPPGHHLARAIR